MILIIGGAYQGKTAYANKHFPDAFLINHLEDYCKEAVLRGESIEEIENSLKEMAKEHSQVVFIGREIGNGVVPVEKETRLYRETYGRLLERLAKDADKVVRVLCGIGQQLK